MTKILAILIIGLVCEAIGVVFLSKGLKQIGPVREVNAPEVLRLIRHGATNGNLLLGVALEAVFFLALLVLLSRHDVSLIWPLTALSFVLTAFFARVVLHEEVSGMRWLGVLLIVGGAGVITYTEKSKPRLSPPEPGASPASLSAPAVPRATTPGAR